ncbi:MAG: SGNH/GDSL hydrolase family protein [Gammaproteobacteria bacterium]|nr:SGNH/GDSL hydrolase family protein [Gammaproteobacteria bacterium]
MPMTFLALGDSYTIGEGVNPDDRWPMQLAAAFRARGLAIAHPHIIAKSGWSTDELLAAIDEEVAQGKLDPPYAFTSLQIGVNNQYRGRSVEDFRAEFCVLLDLALAFAGGEPTHVLVLSIPDWGVTPFAQSAGRDRDQVAREIDAYNAAAESASRSRGVHWVDITDLTRHPDHSHWLVADGLHPSAEMYRLWVERIGRALP